MALIVKFDIETGDVLEYLPSANTGLYVDDNNIPFPGILVNPDISAVQSFEIIFWKVIDGLIVLKPQEIIDEILLQRDAENARQAVLEKVDLGRSIIANLAAEMVLLKLTEEQKASIIISVQDVILMLLAGQVEKAKQLILDLQPNIKIDQVLVDHLKAFIIKEVE